MRNQLINLPKRSLLIVLAFILVTTACGSQVLQKTSLLKVDLASKPECRVIQHGLGETCVSFKPERIVALDIPVILDSLLALGIKPVGMAVDNWGGGRYFPAVMPQKVAGIESVGSEGTPSLEKILLLKPDLILLPEYGMQYYEQLSAIAPTVLIDPMKDGKLIPIKEVFQHVAQVVGKEAEAEDVLKKYQERIQEFRSRLGRRLEGLEISAISHYAGSFWFMPSYASYFQVFKDIGLPIKSVFLEKDKWFTFSIEVIDQYDADILFIVDNPETSIPYLSQQPLILSLKAVKNGQAYIVDPNMWSFYGPIGMNLFLDDLSKYLLGEVQSPFPKHE